MSKIHRHYVHLCTEARQDYSSYHTRRICGSRMPACSKSRHVTNTFLNILLTTMSPQKTGVVKISLCSFTKPTGVTFSACDWKIMDTEIQQKEISCGDKRRNLVFTIVSDTCTFVVLLGCQSMVCGQ